MKTYNEIQEELAEAKKTSKEDVKEIEKVISRFLKTSIKIKPAVSRFDGFEGDFKQNKLGSLSNLFALIVLEISIFRQRDFSKPEESASMSIVITDKFGNRSRSDLSEKLVKLPDGSFEIRAK